MAVLPFTFSSPSPTARRRLHKQDVENGLSVTQQYPTVRSEAAGSVEPTSDLKMTSQNGQGPNVTVLVQGQPDGVEGHTKQGSDSLGHSRQGSDSKGHTRQGSDSQVHKRQGSDSLGHTRQGSDSLGHTRQGSDSQKSNGSDMLIMTPITNPDDLALLAKLDAANKSVYKIIICYNF